METLVGWVIIILFLGFYALMGWMWWRIFKKAGYHGALGILCLMPIANIIMLAILAFKEWPVNKVSSAEKKPASLSTPLIVVIVMAGLIPIMLMLAAIAIPNFLKARLTANESAAGVSLHTILSAVENYAAGHEGRYPSSEKDIAYTASASLPQSFNNKTIQGYNYSLRLDSSGYQIVASPSECGVTGVRIFIGETGGKISDKNCK